MKGVEEKTFDLTIGRVRQTLIQYALPLVVMNLMQSLYSMADLLISVILLAAGESPASIIPARSCCW